MKTQEMTHIFFVRHGQSIHNRDSIIGGQSESPLTELGIEQARSLAKITRDVHFDAAYTSTLSRAYDTCNIICEGRKPTAKRLDDLREQDYGDWEDKDYRDLVKSQPDMFKKFRKDPLHTRPGGGESLAEMAQRVRGVVFDKIIAEHEGQHILCVCHGGVIRTALCLLLDMNLSKHFFLFDVANASLSVVRLGPFGTQLLGLSMRDAKFWRFDGQLID